MRMKHVRDVTGYITERMKLGKNSQTIRGKNFPINISQSIVLKDYISLIENYLIRELI